MIAERKVTEVSLAAQVVADLSFAALPRNGFTAAFEGSGREALYKRDGYFVFTDVPPGDHTLRVSAPRFQPRAIAVTLPLDSPVLGRPGENEVPVLVHTVEAAEQRVLFDPVVLPRGIAAGAEVIAAGAATRLAAALDPGPAMAARLASIVGIVPGSVLRIVRQRSLRLRHDLHSAAPASLVRVVGRITAASPAGLPLAGARVKVGAVNGTAVDEEDVAGAAVASVTVGLTRHLLGFAADLVTETDAGGDYNLYFTATGAKGNGGGLPGGGGDPGGGGSGGELPGGGLPGGLGAAGRRGIVLLDGELLTEVTLEVEKDGYAPRAASVEVARGSRARLDVALTPA